MSLKDRIKDDLKQAMRDKDSARINALRMLQAGIQRREVDERITLDDGQVLAVIDKLVKQGREAIEQFQKGGRADLVDKERADIVVWQNYLPAALSDAEIDSLITQTIQATGASSAKDMGKVMAELKPKLQGRADLGKVSGKVKSALSG